MTTSETSPVLKKHSRVVLSRVEILDALRPGFATETRMLLDQGISAERSAEILSKRFSIAITKRSIASYRTNRWLPERIERQNSNRTLELVRTQLGKAHTLDQLALARLHEMMQTAEFRDINALCLTTLKVRAQDLKEDEFRFKCRQQTEASGVMEEDDSVDEEAKTRGVMNKIREIFALPALPDDASAPPAATDSADVSEEDPVEQAEEVVANEQTGEE